MTVSKSIMIQGPSEKVSQVQTRNYTWEGIGADWGTPTLMDPGGKGYDELYRVGGWDSRTIIWNRPTWPSTRDGSPQYTDKGEFTTEIFAVKGSLPHISAEDRTEYAELADSTEFLCGVYYNDTFAYFLFLDPSLDGVCHPGAYYVIETKEDVESQNIIRNVKDTYTASGFSLYDAIVSGTTRIKMNLAWQPTGDYTGFYLDTSYMEAGGYLRLGPNASGQEQTARITAIVDSGEVDVVPLYYEFAADDPVVYWTSDEESQHDMFIATGSGADSVGLGAGPKEGETYFWSRGDISSETIIELFEPIPWAIPEPYSIRNVPYTNIWLRLDSPSQPFNLSTLVFKVNFVDVTDNVVVTQIPGGIELFYNPPTDFELASRVYVSIYISCSVSEYNYMGLSTFEGLPYVTLSGTTRTYQPGGQVVFGPNTEGDMQTTTIRYIVSDEEIMIEDQLSYDFDAGDLVQYTYDDYPVTLDYWFDVVDDYKPPYFERFNPVDGQEEVAVNHFIMFDIRDAGLGVDISTLSFTVNNLIELPQIYKYSDNWYRVVYTPEVNYYYNSTVECFATVSDLSSSQNRGYAVWSFSTSEAELPIVMNRDPYACAFPVHHKDDIRLDIYGRGGGISYPSILFTWDQHAYFIYTYPKIYRLT